MAKSVVGVIGNAYSVENRFTVQMAGERNLRAIAEVVGALPMVFAERRTSRISAICWTSSTGFC